MIRVQGVSEKWPEMMITGPAGQTIIGECFTALKMVPNDPIDFMPLRISVKFLPLGKQEMEDKRLMTLISISDHHFIYILYLFHILLLTTLRSLILTHG